MSISTTSTSSLNTCRWEWCREIFETADRLARHVLDEHVSKETPVRRKDVRLEMRAHDGSSIGEDSIRTSLLMNEYASIGDEDKEINVSGPINDYTPESPIHKQTGEDEVREELNNGQAPPLLPDLGSLVSILPESSNGAARQSSVSLQPAQDHPPSPTTSGFRALADASSCSPDPHSMSVAPAPSLAEMLANTLNGVANSSYPAGIAGPIVRKRADPRSQSNGVRSSSRPSSAKGMDKTTESQVGEALRPVNGAGLRPALSHFRSRSWTSSNSSSQVQSALPDFPTLPSTSAAGDGQSNSQNRSQSETQTSSTLTSSARSFRSGSIRLEPNLPPEAPAGPIFSHSYVQSQPQSQGQSEARGSSAPSPLIQPSEPTANPYIDDIDMLSSSLEPSIPVFSQAFDMQSQSQWPLATQAPYSPDSQLAFSSQEL